MVDSSTIRESGGNARPDTKRELIGQVAHDFNNLLTPLLAYPQLIRLDLPKDSTSHELLDIVEKATKDMIYMSQQLLMFSSPMNKIRLTALALDDVLTHCLDSLGSGIVPDGITLNVNLNGDGVQVDCATDAVSTCVVALVMNAVEAMDGDGCIALSTMVVEETKRHSSCGVDVQSGRYAKIVVSDTGSGVHEEIMGEMFEPMTTMKKGAQRRGSGLGLAIASKIMHAHGGYIDLERSAGDGATFSLSFPIVVGSGDRECRVVGGKAGEQQGLEPCDRNRVLLVDDEKTILHLFKMILGGALPDCILDVAGDGEEAVRLLERHHHAVVLMDLHMPVKDGCVAFREMESLSQKKGWEMPAVIFCTGFAPPGALKDIVSESSIHCLLAKPINNAALLSAVKRQLGRP